MSSKIPLLLLDRIKAKIESHQGLVVFGKQRSKFEGWLKVEICGLMVILCWWKV